MISFWECWPEILHNESSEQCSSQPWTEYLGHPSREVKVHDLHCVPLYANVQAGESS